MDLQEPHIGIPQCWQGLHHCTVPRIVPWLLRCLLVLLLCYCFMQSTPLFTLSTAYAQDLPLVVQEIRYRMPDAGEVFLVWGIDGWVPVLEEIRPTGTILKNGVMHTPMDREGDTFVAKVQVPLGTTIDYVFQTTETRGGTSIEIWDTNGDQDYHTVATQDGVAELRQR